MKIFFLLLICFLSKTFCIEIDSDIAHEAHSILKRFVETDHEFTHHDIAIVLHEKDKNSFHHISKRDLKSVSENSETQKLRLELSSGSTMHLNLRKRSVFDENTEFHEYSKNGLVKRSQPLVDCYLTGDIEVDGKSEGMASVAVCDGLHGSALNDGIEYYIHPIENAREDHMVHILSRRAANTNEAEDYADEIYNDTLEYDGIYKREASDRYATNEILRNRYKREVNADTYKTATSFVIEMAVFVDAEYFNIIQKRAPGREDEYILLGMAAVNAIFSNEEKVGYDASIKIKYYERWIVDPEEYTFDQSLGDNLRSFCVFTRDKYLYDMHFLHTGVTRQGGPAAGMAYVGGVCKKHRCANALTTGITRWSLIAHEIGHNLGFSHHGAAKCPKEIKALANGFMGNGAAHFSPCNKWELNDFFSKGNGQCLFEETAITETSGEYANLAALFPGQYLTPDEQCRLFVGDGYEFYRPYDLTGREECIVFLCMNRNKDTPEYMRVVKQFAVMGFPCGEEMYCRGGDNCFPWETPHLSWDVQYLRSMKKEYTWSEWSADWSECSRECGTGAQIKTRQCLIDTKHFLSPYCKGESIRSRLCNLDPCPGDPTTVKEIRKARGNEVCQRFYENNVTLKTGKKSRYLPEIGNLRVRDSSAGILKTKNCLLMCERNPEQWNHLDGIFPDGTPCYETKKRSGMLKRYNISLHCVQGVCTEMSDCQNNAMKDTCGICGGDPVRCKSLVIDSSYDVPSGETATLATFPAGTSEIDVSMTWWKNKGVRFEVWNGQGEKIFGKGALFPKTKYHDSKPADYAGTKWAFEYVSYIRANGPIDQEMVVKVTRTSDPIKEIFIDYLLPDQKK